jgi:hypothetical protein
MIRDMMYTTPEGFQLAHPLALPDARDFSEVLTYAGEWDHAFMTSSGSSYRPDLVPAPRYWPALPDPPHRLGTKSGKTRQRNEIGPFCSVEMTQLGGPAHRSIAVTITDDALSAVSGSIVTDDDHMSFKVIGHADTGRALIILSHGHIIGSHYLAYVDPATTPAYPFEARDDAAKRVVAEIEASGHEVYQGNPTEPHEIVYRAFTRIQARTFGMPYSYDWQGDPIRITPAGEVVR